MDSNSSNKTTDLSQVIPSIILLARQNLILLVATIGLTFTAGIIYYLVSDRVYQSKMIIQSDILSESYSLRLAENIDDHIRGKDLDFLAAALNMTPDETRQLGEFKIISALTPMSQQMAEREKIIVVISVRVRDNAILPKLQAGIVGYFSNNAYIRKRVDFSRKRDIALIDAINNELKRLDTLKNKISNGTFSGARIGGVSLMNVADIYNLSTSLYEKKFFYTSNLEMVDSIQVIEGLTPYGKAVWPKLSIVLLMCLILSGVGIFVAMSFKSLNR